MQQVPVCCAKVLVVCPDTEECLVTPMFTEALMEHISSYMSPLT